MRKAKTPEEIARKRLKKQKETGFALVCLGGLIVIMNLTSFNESEWKLEASLVALVPIALGIYIIQRAKKMTKG